MFDPTKTHLYYVCGDTLLGMRDDVPERCKTCVRCVAVERHPDFLPLPICSRYTPIEEEEW